ncbi:peptidoglycan DD-metalloendopeptidase family protein [Larsenimonas rhizosphaerae]|uniref:peptidoglycan DD-metalloendopeptidase family protein n=1 Tax=Larsenimonas rhizosphaerae TaxID=2944682 RepID=UPI002034204D|nr:peptidoglycan DD-metalloendopeptidase family protein [Larsenimonas rhizosphaerae]MCM2131811.1 peptidoglycan DD-metalloendopeptidase family protein [Larsenimonas rhizosphaerae]
MSNYKLAGSLAAVLLLAGCGTNATTPQVQDLSFNRQQADKPVSYQIHRGDTLYSIAWQHDVDFRQLAALNNIEAPYNLRPGQTLRLSAAGDASTPTVASSQGATTSPLGSSSDDTDDSWLVTSDAEDADGAVDASGTLPPAGQPSSSTVDSKGNDVGTAVAGETTAEKPAKQQYSPVANVAWQWPVKGKVVGDFTQSRNITAGIDIAGQKGQSVKAAGPGIVVYAGNGVRGYGNLIIIKHNDHFLSAYAHNQSLNVKENDVVSAGQTIATMGNSDADQVALHFEIRKDGQPQDPLNYLPDQA